MNRRSSPGWLSPVLALLAFVACVFSMPRVALAVPSIGTGVSSTTAIINKIINTTPGLNTITTTGTGVTVAAAGDTAVVARGLTIPVGAAATTSVTAGRIAGVAARVIKGGGWVGIAAAVAPWIMDQAGIKVCPAPDFFCKAGPDSATDPVSGGWRISSFPNTSSPTIFAGTAQAACDKAVGVASPSYFTSYPKPWTAVARVDPTQPWMCNAANGNFVLNVSRSPATCPAGSTKSADGYSCTMKGPDVPATENDVGTAVEGAITGQPTRIQFLYGGLVANNAPVFSPTDPVTVTPKASTVSAPTETSTQTVPKPDGSIDTVTTQTKTDVKPTVTGTTLGDTNISYPTTITTTTTTTNNVTNVTTTTTNVTNVYATPGTKTNDNPADRPPPVIPDPTAPKPDSDIKIPTDYNREVTQQSILTSLNAALDQLKTAFGPITTTPPTGDPELAAIKAKNDEGTAAVDGITEASTGLRGWFPTIPTAACVDPRVPIPISGGELAVPICDKVDVFSKFISAVICVFALYGCVREVQSALKA